MLARKTKGKGNIIYHWWECKLIEPWKSVWRVLKKLKIDLLYDPSIPLLGRYSKEHKSIYKRNSCIPMFIAALFITAELESATLPNNQ
jgi:hypothetical protein